MASHNHHAQDHGHGHAHGHAHDHGHHHHGPGHVHAPASFGRAFAIGITLNLGFVAAEVVFGLAAGSMALLADAGHNLSDVLGLVVAWGGTVLAKAPPSRRFTYGLRGSSILAALFNALFLLVATGAIALEAIERLGRPAAVPGATIMAVAAAGILVNGFTAWLFARGRDGDINIRATYLHMAADAAVSAGVVLAGLAIRLTGATWIDSVVSLAILAVIFVSTWRLLSQSVVMALAAVPEGIDLEEVEAALGGQEGVIRVHHVHVWPMSTTEVALTAHLVTPEPSDRTLLARTQTMLQHRFGISHATLQTELEADCAAQPERCR